MPPSYIFRYKAKSLKVSFSFVKSFEINQTEMKNSVGHENIHPISQHQQILKNSIYVFFCPKARCVTKTSF